MHELIFKFETEIQRLHWLTALNNLETAVRRYALALKYRPDQLRVPAGNPDGGQWTHEGGSESVNSQEATVRLVSEKIPSQKPRTRDLRRGLRGLGIGLLFEAIKTLEQEQRASALSSIDPPKTLEELQQAVSDPRPGYDIHHIVERNTAARDGSEGHLIDAPENLVRIPRWKHWDLNSWYETQNKDYENMTPREYVRGKSWEVRRQVGLDGLRTVGVLKP